jgi:acyl-CoA reductase-like NAD-dependent aldehyde dehydrogenase
MATDTLTTPAITGTTKTTKTKIFKNFIDGEWVDSASGQTFEDRNPADTREVGRHLPTLEQSRCGCRRRRRQARLSPSGASFPRLAAPKWSSAPPKS